MADATATPRIDEPDFLKTWHTPRKKEGEVAHCFKPPDDGPYETVTLFDFIFLGVNFKQNPYFVKKGSPDAPPDRTIFKGGVCAELMPILQNAQLNIYKSYAAQSLIEGKTPTETGFGEFCNVKEVSGWQFRPGQHRVGSAIDVDAGDNPYIVTRTGSTIGGEAHAEIPKDMRDALRNAAMEGYQNAWLLVTGKPLPAEQVAGFETEGTAPGGAYDRFAEMHGVLKTYLTMAHEPARGNSLPISGAGFPRPFDGDPTSFMATVDRHARFLRGLDQFKSRKDLLEKIRRDYDVFQLVFCKGNLRKVKGGIANLGLAPTDGFRDPCHGFLTIRKEIVEGIWGATKPMRWGGTHFRGPLNGDMMHFDRMPTAFTKTGNDPNPDKFFFTRK